MLLFISSSPLFILIIAAIGGLILYLLAPAEKKIEVDKGGVSSFLPLFHTALEKEGFRAVTDSWQLVYTNHLNGNKYFHVVFRRPSGQSSFEVKMNFIMDGNTVTGTKWFSIPTDFTENQCRIEIGRLAKELLELYGSLIMLENEFL